MRRIQQWFLGLLSLLSVCLLAGCGGGGGGGASGGGGGNGEGFVRVRVDWPARGRYVPPYAESLVAKITVGEEVYQLILNRSGDSGHQDQATFGTTFPPGSYSLTAEAYSEAAGEGTKVASASISVNVQANQTTTSNVSANLQTEIDHVEIDGQPLSVTTGNQTQLLGHAEDALGNTLLLPPSALTWTITAGSSNATLSPTGLFTAVQPGACTVRLAETGANKTATATVTITGTLPADRVFYSLFGDTATEIYHMASTGGGNTLFQSLPLTISVAALNPDGNLWAFFYTADPMADAPTYDIYTNTTPSFSGATRRTTANYLYPGTVQFTSDGTQIVYTASPAESDFGLYRVGTSAGSPTRITAAVLEEAHINASNKIVATQLSGGAGEIVTVNLDGTGLTNVSNHASEDFMPQWSKDGSKICWSTNRNGDFDVYTMNANGTGVTRVTTTAFDEMGPTLNDAGSQLAFTVLSGDPSGFGVYRINSNGTGRTQILANPTVADTVYWTSLAGRAAGDGVNSPLGRYRHWRRP